MNLIAEKLITNAEAKELLEKRKEEGELKYEQKNALETLKKFVTIDTEKVRKIREKLEKIEKLRERQIIQIANLLPKDEDDLRVILQKDYTLLTPEEVKLVLEAVKKTL